MKKLNSLLLSAILIAVYSLPAMAADDSGISVIQNAPAESTGGIAPSNLGAGGLGALSGVQLIALGLVVIGVAAAGGGGGGSSSPSGTQ